MANIRDGFCDAACLWQAVLFREFQDGHQRGNLAASNHGWKHIGRGHLHYDPTNLSVGLSDTP